MEVISIAGLVLNVYSFLQDNAIFQEVYQQQSAQALYQQSSLQYEKQFSVTQLDSVSGSSEWRGGDLGQTYQAVPVRDLLNQADKSDAPQAVKKSLLHHSANSVVLPGKSRFFAKANKIPVQNLNYKISSGFDEGGRYYFNKTEVQSSDLAVGR